MIGKFLVNVTHWFALSSKNPENTSLTLKAVLTVIATIITMSMGLANISVPIDSLTPIVDLIISWVQTFVLIVSLSASIYGAIRKVWLSITNKNHVLQ